MIPNKVSEKRKPHYDLKELKRLVRQGRWKPTKTAEKGAVALGLSRAEIKDVVLSLKPEDFYKSMTSIYNHSVWQDVYKPRINLLEREESLELYVKLQKSFDGKCVIISFKRSEVSDDV